MQNLFGEVEVEVEITKSKRKTYKNLFTDYDNFVEKFEIKKTTDDCYTPDNVYNIVLDWVNNNCYMTGINKIFRPFYPGEDYKNIKYPEDCAIIDNPPFSILSEIIKFYNNNNIKFFLFANHLTLFSSTDKYTAVVCGAHIKYENGAVINTSFITNMLGNCAIISAPDLYKSLENLNIKKKLPKYKYPDEVLTVSMVQKFVENGIDFKINNNQCLKISELNSQKKYKKFIFGKGFLLSKQAKQKKILATINLEKNKEKNKDNIIYWEISNSELKLIDDLE